MAWSLAGLLYLDRSLLSLSRRHAVWLSGGVSPGCKSAPASLRPVLGVGTESFTGDSNTRADTWELGAVETR